MTAFRILLLLAFGAFPALCQIPSPDSSAPAQPLAAETAHQRPQEEAPRSTLVVTPGGEVIKQKDLWNETGYLHPFLRMPKYILRDQKAIWTSPFHTSRENARWWAIFGTATAAFIATDQWSVKQLPNSSTQVSVSKWGSRFGTAYSLIPLSASFYFIGTAQHQDRFRETGLMGFEALIDSTVTVEAFKLAANRARPLEGNGKGRFEDSPNSRWKSGFPSGHAINSWAMASVVAHQYPRPLIIPIIAYGLASTVVVARVGARRHFPATWWRAPPWAGSLATSSMGGGTIKTWITSRRSPQEFSPASGSMPQFPNLVKDRTQDLTPLYRY